MKGKTFVRLVGILLAILLIVSLAIVICFPVEACPGGNSVVYGYGGEDITIGLIVTILCTTTIVMFGLNVKGYLSKKGASFKAIIVSFLFVIGTAILNILTFVFFIKPDNEYVMHGPTSSIHTTEVITPLIFIGVIMLLVGIIYTKLR